MNEQDKNLVIIDADSLVYIIGYELSALQLEPLGIIKLDEFITDILKASRAKNYLGFFGGNCGRNFRKDIAVTKEYKGNRTKEKEDWYTFWEPILKKHMETKWKFTKVCNIEADDACAIAANVYKDKYNKIILATPDKDLFQIPDTWFYNYNKRVSLYCSASVANYKLCSQLITGDSSDNIPGCEGAGPTTAEKYLQEQTKYISKEVDTSLLDKIELFYIDWYTNILRDKVVKKQEKDYLIQYKKDNDIARFTKKTKDKALQSFKPDESEILTKEEAVERFKEQYKLIKLIDNEEEGKKHGFILPDVLVDTTVDWNEVIKYEDELNQIEELDNSIEFIPDIIVNNDDFDLTKM